MKLKPLVLRLSPRSSPLALPGRRHAPRSRSNFSTTPSRPTANGSKSATTATAGARSEVDADWAPYADGYWTYTDARLDVGELRGLRRHRLSLRPLGEGGGRRLVLGAGLRMGPGVGFVAARATTTSAGRRCRPRRAGGRDVGISVWVDSSYDIGPAHYNFCRVRDFGAPVLRPVIVHRYRECRRSSSTTVNITNISYNNGARTGDLQRRARVTPTSTGTSTAPIPALKLVRNTNVTVVNNTIINNNVRVTNFNTRRARQPAHRHRSDRGAAAAGATGGAHSAEGEAGDRRSRR